MVSRESLVLSKTLHSLLTRNVISKDKWILLNIKILLFKSGGTQRRILFCYQSKNMTIMNSSKWEWNPHKHTSRFLTNTVPLRHDGTKFEYMYY